VSFPTGYQFQSPFSVENLKEAACAAQALRVVVPAFALSAFAKDSGRFTFHYAFTVKNLPRAKRVRVWIPAAQSDAYQEVRVVSAKADLPLKKKREGEVRQSSLFR
jgi:hypothetical protein